MIARDLDSNYTRRCSDQRLDPMHDEDVVDGHYQTVDVPILR